MAANVSLPNTLTNGQPNDASQVMADLNALVTWINTNAVHLDGAKAMTGTLSGPAGTDPVSADQYTRKAYVDAQVSAEAALRVTGDSRIGAGAARVANQSINAASTALISFDTETWDSSTFFAPTSTNITVPASQGGIYVVSAYCINVTNTNSSSGEILLNGSVLFAVPFAATTSTTNIHGTGGGVVLLAAGDVLTLNIRNGGVGANNYTGHLRLAKISV